MEILKVLPKNLLSRMVGELTNLELPGIVAIKARDWFIKRYKINMDEAELPLSHYPSIAKLFIRKLKPGIRPIQAGYVHPCDGVLTHAEKIKDDTLVQAKGRDYNLSKLLMDEQAPRIFDGGSHLVYYLCPTDYHRVHSPVDGQVKKVTHVPGHLWPVNEWSVKNIPNLFAVNERIIFHIETQNGPVALVMVGATNVGKITVSFDPEIIANQRGRQKGPFEKNYAKPISVHRGDELGVFNMGSTVVVLYAKGMLKALPQLGPVKLGRSVED